jgi:RNA polymerase sigma factor (TIGR02999 family)
MNDVTGILRQMESGDPTAAAQLLPLVYDELRRLAAHKMAGESPDHTLQATALVHEAYLRLVASGGDEPPGGAAQQWTGRRHFFAAAAEAMRRILIEAARHKQSLRAGGEWQRLEVSDVEQTTRQPQVDVLELSEALDRLEARDARKAALVKLRFFAGLTNEQAADALGISTATADNDWAYAKSWLRVQLDRDA